MEHHKVKSSAFESAGYDPDSSTMEIRFKGGKLYRSTSNVPRHVFDKMMAAESIGKHFAEHVKPHHAFEPVPEPKRGHRS